jgi:Spirocyclase AveC-like
MSATASRGATTLAVGPEPSAIDRRRLRPVMGWALLGAMFLALMAYEWIASAVDGDLHATTAGRSSEPGWATFSVHAQEAALGLAALVVIWFFVIRPWRREGRLSADGMMVIAWATMWAIQDPWVSYSQSTITYNAAALNLGCPQCHVPGWLSNRALAEPIIWGLGCYIAPMFLATVLVGRLMGWSRARWPRLGNLGLVIVAIGSMGLSDLVLECFWTRTGVYTYGGGSPSLSLFAHSYYKYPLWVGAIWGIAWGLIASIRFFKDDHGRTIVERGIDRVRTGSRRRQVLRLLAFVGVMNACFAFVYNVPVQYFSLHASAFPADLMKRPYLLGGVCGPGTKFACPDKRVPIPRGTRSGRVTPAGTFVAPHGLPNDNAAARR